MILRGRRSRNKVFVGETAEGSIRARAPVEQAKVKFKIGFHSRLLFSAHGVSNDMISLSDCALNSSLSGCGFNEGQCSLCYV